ncbi:hypothetical protein EW026_g477 [Hermanssonia centrifuga]|uniref:Integral membrane protein n=1 Tax=Hermanssonia centrifuga TaxID=98765 RepID=A0A4S4KV61_9APHY|nr:hypothetical protein EW026_g477 [Hermanssonia centrifuga]
MRAHWQALPLLIPALAAAFAVAAPPSPDASHDLADIASEVLLTRRDEHEHGHGHQAATVMVLNETEILLYHAPTPPSYWSIDFGDRQPDDKRYPGLMGLHIAFMVLAFFGALPVGIALRSVKHAWHGLSVIMFYVFVTLGLSASGLYRKLTPNMYEGQKHGLHGWLVLIAAAALSTLDVLTLVLRTISYIRSIRAGEQRFAIKACWNTIVLDREDKSVALGAEYAGLVAEETDEYEAAELKAREIEGEISDQPAPTDTGISPRHSDEHEADQWVNNYRRHSRYPQSADSARTVFGVHSPRGSVHSDETLPVGDYFSGRSKGLTRASLIKKIGRALFATAERSLVFAGLMQLLTGIVIYTGGCRENYVNACLAHLIKGGIFWSYGLVTFARFLGSFSELGWAWNRSPSRDYVSAEFVECAVIFVYGITNTWMERFGAHPGDPYTTKQVQHISIAVMFWFAGLVGMGIESKRVRRWLASSATAAVPAASRSQEAVAEPPSYVASFNPFPALCIGITGAAMAAHFQEYLFQVQIHMLWGNLLTAFAVLRCLTYFFLWIGPPRSILPSRPPTEALASFFLACGGLVFQLSTEEVTIAAMRRGHDDVMMFLNLAVAITCLAFCWTLGIVAFKGWLKSHSQKSVKFHSSA